MVLLWQFRRRNSVWNNLFAPVGGNDRWILCKETNRFYSRTWPGYRVINLWYFISGLDVGLCLVYQVNNFSTKWRGCVFYLAALKRFSINPLNAELNPICYLLALLAHHFLHVSRIRVKSLTLRLLMSCVCVCVHIYIYIYIHMEHLVLMFLDHTQRRSTVGRTPLDE